MLTLWAMTLGEMVFDWRTAHGLSRASLGKRIKVDGETVLNLEKGKTRRLNDESMALLAEVMGKPLTELVAAIPPPPKKSPPEGENGAMQIVEFALKHGISPAAITLASELVKQAASQSPKARRKSEDRGEGK